VHLQSCYLQKGSLNVKATHQFVVAPQVPSELGDLIRLASNQRWAWHRPTRELFDRLDPDAWHHGAEQPLVALGQVRQERLVAAAADPEFRAALSAATADLDDAVHGDRWFQTFHRNGPLQTIAYFSPEFGVTEAVPQYSGGLGILAGDHLKAASDLGIPLVAIGLFYRNGYFRQGLTSDGWQQERFPEQEPLALGLTDMNLSITVDLGGLVCTAKIWRADVGRTPLYLLDTDIDANPAGLREITDRLYGGDSEHRIRQEILLGVGGVRALDALGITAQVFHTNEGHAGFLALERIRQAVGRGFAWSDAIELTRAGTLFTTHTPVPAGIDRFHIDVMRRYFASFATQCGVTFEQLFTLGQAPGEEADRFNMAVMGLRLSAQANGVAALHGEVSRSMFNSLWPELEATDVPITSVTNGVHAHSWVSEDIANLFAKSVSPVWDGAIDDEWERAKNIPTLSIMTARAQGRAALVDDVRRRIGRPEVLSPDVLTVGFARRFATYKRATLLLAQPERLLKLLAHPSRPVQFVFAGKAHPADDEGKGLIQEIYRFSLRPEAQGHFVFVDDYDIALARTMYHGTDVWLNNPRRPLEACGTSGMKAALNGALNCSIRDGWWDEWTDGKNGWDIASFDSVADLAARDRLEADSLFGLLENSIIPTFYDEPEQWWSMVRHNWATLGPKVTASRMVREYTERLYVPAATHAAQLAASDGAPARALAAWKTRVAAAWPAAKVAAVEVDTSPAGVGEQRPVRATIDLGGLSADDVLVEAVHGQLNGADEIVAPTADRLTAHDGAWVGSITTTATGRYGVTVRVRPNHTLLSSSRELGLERRG
jgi:glycogen phosphorylase